MKELIEIQSELKAPKSQYNSFGKYHYRNAEDILEAVKPLLKQHNCTLTITDEPIVIEGWHYIKAVAIIKNGNGEIESTTAYAREEESKKGMDSAQVTGATSSYARKYALNGLLAIDDTKDADTTNTQTKETKQASAPKLAPQVQQTPAQPQTNETPSLQEVCDMIQNAKDKDELTAIWKKYKPLYNGNEDFTKAIKTAPANPNRKE